MSCEHEFRTLVYGRALERIQEAFKPAARRLITTDMIERAVDEAVKVSNADLALMTKYPDMFCDRCGECCRRSNPISVDADDIAAIAFAKGIEPGLAVANFTREAEHGRLSLQTPCPFLHGNLCSIYWFRPKVCRVFPLTYNRGRDNITIGIYPYCRFAVNHALRKTITILCRLLIEQERPDLAYGMKLQQEELAKRVSSLPQVQQIRFFRKYLSELERQIDGHEERSED